MGSEDTGYFEAAFWTNANEVDAPTEDKARLLRELLSAFSRGNPGAGDKAAERFFAKGYNWPRYAEYLSDLPAQSRPYKPGMLFNHRVTLTAYSRRNETSRLRLKESRPLWKFSAVGDDRTPAECRALDGTVKRCGDPFWRAHPIPCRRLFCRCTIISMPDG